jgi:hypothetical protein
MITPPPGVQVYLARGYTDMRKGMATLAMLVQQTLGHDPFSGAIYAFRGRRGGLIKVLWHDGVGMCLFIKRLERFPRSRFRRMAGTVGHPPHCRSLFSRLRLRVFVFLGDGMAVQRHYRAGPLMRPGILNRPAPS